MLVPQNPHVDPAGSWAVEFDGIRALLETETEVSLGTGPWSVGAWFTAATTSPSSYPHFLTAREDQANFACKCTQDGKPYFYSSGTGSIKANTTMDLSKWNHVAFTYDGSVLKIYINGNLDLTSDSSLGIDVPTTHMIAQGGNLEFSGGYQSGTFLFDRDLSEKEIKKFATSRLTGREPGLLFYWPTVEGSGQQVKDWSINKNNGMFTEFTYAVIVEQASDDDAVRFGSTSLPNSSQYTIEFWLYPISSSGQHPYLSIWDGADAPFLIDNYDGNLRFHTAGTNISTSLPTLSEWSHLAVVFEQNEANGDDLKIYLDGSLVATGDAGGTSAATYSASLYMGRKQDSLTALADCVMTDIRIWEVARTQAEIQNNKDKRLTGNESGLYIYYPFNEGSGSTIAPSTSAGNNGTIEADADWSNPYSWSDESKRLTLDGPFPRWAKYSPA